MPEMKIYKSDLQGLIEECKQGPYYICNFKTSLGGEFPTETYTVTVAAWNAEHQVCELLLASGPVWLYDDVEKPRAQARAKANEQEVRERLDMLGLQVRDGRISETPVRGGLG